MARPHPRMGVTNARCDAVALAEALSAPANVQPRCSNSSYSDGAPARPSWITRAPWAPTWRRRRASPKNARWLSAIARPRPSCESRPSRLRLRKPGSNLDPIRPIHLVRRLRQQPVPKDVDRRLRPHGLRREQVIAALAFDVTGQRRRSDLDPRRAKAPSCVSALAATAVERSFVALGGSVAHPLSRQAATSPTRTGTRSAKKSTYRGIGRLCPDSVVGIAGRAEDDRTSRQTEAGMDPPCPRAN